MFQHPSIAEIPEGELVALLLSEPVWRMRLTELDGIPTDPLILQQVSLEGVPGGFFGDIDILLCDVSHPDLAVAIEAKRIKLDSSAIRRELPKKLPELRKALQQVNRLADIGFWRVYLYVFVVVDTREQNLGRSTYEGLSAKLNGVVSRSVSPLALNERVGLYEVTIVQPMDYEPLSVGTWSGHLHRNSQMAPQSRELTKWVASHMTSIVEG